MDNQVQNMSSQVQVYKDRYSSVSNLLKTYEPAIKNALPKFLTPDRMIRVALTAMSKNPTLLECTPHSLIGCVLTSAQLGLLPDEVLGEAYLIPFRNRSKGIVECTFIVGYRGLCQLAMRSGQVKSVQARAVYAANKEGGDFFEYEFGLNEKLQHIPSGLRDPKHITHFYAIVKFNNGGHVFHVATRAEVESIRDESQSYKWAKNKSDTIWGKFFEEMGSKTVLRKLMKFVPLSPEINRAIGLDERADVGVSQMLGTELLNAGSETKTTEDAIAEIIQLNSEAQLENEQLAQEMRGTNGQEILASLHSRLQK